MYGLPACLALEHCVHEARGLDVLCLGASLPFCLSNLSALCRLWESAQKTAHSLPARLAVEHCVHEARGLDVLPSTVHKFKNNGDAESAALLEDVIYAVSTGGPWGPHGCSAIVEAALHCLIQRALHPCAALLALAYAHQAACMRAEHWVVEVWSWQRCAS